MGYDSDSASDRLTAVRQAIAKALEAIEYGIGSRRKRMAEIRDLRQLEKELMGEVSSESGTQISVLTMDKPA